MVTKIAKNLFEVTIYEKKKNLCKFLSGFIKIKLKWINKNICLLISIKFIPPSLPLKQSSFFILLIIFFQHILKLIKQPYHIHHNGIFFQKILISYKIKASVIMK